MAAPRTTRVVVAGAGMAAGLVAGVLARRARGGSRRPDAARAAFLDERRARIHAAHLQLVAPPESSGS
jgi:hypothetical protein